jgi:hypothetical protein
MRKLLFNHWPYLLLTLIVSVIAVVNYVPGTILTGWDNLHPEYNFLLNIKRSLFSVWQEYQGLGLLGGHAHSTDILRQITLYGLSFLFPITMLRYLSTFFMLLAGAIGAYVFIKIILSSSHPGVATTTIGDPSQKIVPLWESHQKDPIASLQNDNLHVSIPAFLGALFYLLNLATVQTFYAPFEAFTAHFAALPWLLWASLTFLITPSRKHVLFLILALLFALPMAYIPTLFIVYLIALGICFLVIFFNHNSVDITKKNLLSRGTKLGGFIFLINSFWLLPFFYFTVTNASVNLNSKINQMATETIFLQNKEFGTLAALPLLKGFWFNNTDPDREGTFTYMMDPWRDHMANPLIAGIGYLLFIVVLTGAYAAFRQKHSLMRIFPVLLLFSFIALAIAAPPFSWINDVIRHAVPLLNQAFRFPFTKFSILAGLTYAVLFAIGIRVFLMWWRVKLLDGRWLKIEDRLRRWKIDKRNQFSNFNSLPSILHHLPSLLIVFLLIVFTLPLFQGHLFYEKERIVLPKEYTDLFTFFRTQDPSGRIANLPQHTFWGWNFYSWGYGGSGFLWYGIEQPILDRAFDVWSAPSENYYFELSQAVYEKNPQALRRVLDKYQISWLLLDKNSIYPPSPKALFYPELERLLGETEGISLTRTFGNIRLYQNRRTAEAASHFVSLTDTLPTTNAATWTNADIAYANLGMYYTSPEPDYLYPFSATATVKTPSEHAFTISETESEILLATTIPPRKKPGYLRLPAYVAAERIVPVTLRTISDKKQLIIQAVIRSPQVSIGNRTYAGKREIRPLFVITDPQASQFPYRLNINGAVEVTINEKPETVLTTFLSLTDVNVLALTSKNGTPRQIRINPDELTALPIFSEQIITLAPSGMEQTLTIRSPKIDDRYLSFTVTADHFKQVANCDVFRNGSVETRIIDEEAARSLEISSDNATACTSFFADSLPHDLGYVIQVTGTNTTGRPLHFWIENIDQRRGAIDTYLPSGHEKTTTSYLLPPMETFGRAYAFHFDNIAIVKERPVNSLETVSVAPFPYRYSSSLVITRDKIIPESITEFTLPDVTHPNESLYIVTLPQTNREQTLILSQAYDPGWKAYELAKSKGQRAKWYEIVFPFIFGKEISNHVKVNNWSNGWFLDNSTPFALSSTQIIIVYFPQYLQYFGFFLVVSTLVWLGITALLKRRA